jgi:hypothetical protein
MEKKSPRILSKKEVNDIINSGQVFYDSLLSNRDNSNVYKFPDGGLIYKRTDGKGVYWSSLEQIDQMFKEKRKEGDILDMKGWIDSKESYERIRKKSFEIIKSIIKEIPDYSKRSLLLVSKRKVRDIIKEKDLFYAIIVYSCEVASREIGGNVELELIEYENCYMPIVRDSVGRIYIPYIEFLKSYVEKFPINIAESVDIELHKFKFMQ